MTAPLRGTCGCGAPGTVYVMSDRLWVEFFAVEGATRPATATACNMCVADWNAYAGPLTPARTTD